MIAVVINAHDAAKPQGHLARSGLLVGGRWINIEARIWQLYWPRYDYRILVLRLIGGVSQCVMDSTCVYRLNCGIEWRFQPS
jgi:hypothetical protein